MGSDVRIRPDVRSVRLGPASSTPRIRPGSCAHMARRTPHRRPRWTWSALLGFGALLSSGASAQSVAGPTRVAVFPVSVGTGSLRELAGALDPVLMSNLHDLPQIEVTTRPALDLPATQLAIDCVGQTRDCLGVVTQQSNTDALLSPELQLAGQETVVTLLYFDARGKGELRSVTRRYSGSDIERLALDDVPSMVRELFGLPEPEPPPPALDTSFAVEMGTPPRESAWPALPVTLTVTGLVILGVGAGFGLAAKATESEYADIPIDDASTSTMAKELAAQAHDLYAKADKQALVCNILLGVGGATLLTGATLWIVHLANRGGSEHQLSLAPQLGPGELGLQMNAKF
jgi:hypothetical protein